MKDKVFIYSNVLLYIFSDNDQKKQTAKNLIKENPVISVQVLNEVSNVLYKKFAMAAVTIIEIINRLSAACSVKNITIKTIISALGIAHK